MTLEHAILGFLSYRPFSGYDLKKMFDNSVRHFWYADQSQIYRTLSRLEDKGLVVKETIHQEDRPDRKEYQILPAGRDELLRWLQSTVSSGQAHSAPLVQVFFAGKLSDEQALTIFEQGVEILRAVLWQYDAIPGIIEEYRQMIGSEREAFFWNLTLESGLAMVHSQLEWMESVIQRFREHQVPQS